MNMNDLIVKKRDGGALSKDEIRYFINGYTEGEIPDYQAAALLMAIFFRKMDKFETFELTDAMRYSGDTIDLAGVRGIKVDKHSTGGVGDKTTLIVAPLAAACGIPIAKMSGRGLGFTGGTVDKLEAIPGFRTAMEPEDFLQQVNDIGIAVIGQTAHITPADKKLYALRDVTGTVENLSLIASSIMSKKLAAGSDAIVLDVKCGRGAFMEEQAEAEALGEIMCEIGRAAGKKTVAAITDMSQPLGKAVGNSLEVIEAIETLKGRGPSDITALSLCLAGIMICLGGRVKTTAEGKILARQALESGAGLNKLRSFIARQGGDERVIDDYELFPQSSLRREILAREGGFINGIDARAIGLASQHTGAGRRTKEDDIDLSAGIVLHKKTGDKVSKGECLATVFSSSQGRLADAEKEVARAFDISKEKKGEPKLVKKVLGL
ncbi:pyrimidine-nucleoside phosphorylase [Ihubacter sp. rT4E-8]|uniref:pyrimidine-nucleoside phosphorylase n=1 Tax=Ihubacter sp. rT4E-8 TaxID=3242369 RepID=UPI003CEF83FB